MTEFIDKAARFQRFARRSPRQAVKALFLVLLGRLRAGLIRPASRSGFLASVYFTFFSSRFYREHRAVLSGIVANLNSDIALQRSSSQLRRNIHRLEKGLIMRPRRAVFAEDYIEATVSLFLRGAAGAALDRDELKWAADVLTTYFSVVSETPRIGKAKERFLAWPGQALTPSFVPYPSSSRARSDISFDQLYALFSERRSVRWYSPTPVPQHLVEKAVSAASLASSACNRQPYSFLLFRDPEKAARIASLAGGTGGFSKNIPCLILIVGDLSYYVHERDRHLVYIDASLASAQLMLAFQTLGLSTCAINWPDVEENEKALQAAVGLKAHERVIMFIAVGYADQDGQIPYSQKKGADVLLQAL
ncbi:nitroreductase family protein [Mesorhizobium sp. M1312]|uniref:nitroreductase family protein n=1 Tax=unclassified Mesorhizobium TaxID=325217 RepID=UPI00333CDCA3